MIGLTLDLPSDQRVEGTVATTVSGYMKGCRFFRVHDVKRKYACDEDDRSNLVQNRENR